METPKDRKYTKEHEWVRLQGAEAELGITFFAQDQLGEIVFVELPKVGTELTAGKSFCVVESTKAASDVYAPLSGKVIAVNDALVSDPSLINQDPYESGWLVKLGGVQESDMQALMDAGEYEVLVNS